MIGNLIIHILLIGLDVNDGTKLVFTEEVIVFWFAATDNDETLCHCKEGVHGGGIAVELVEDDVAGVHQVLVLGEGNVLGGDDFEAFGAEVGLETAQG